MAATPPISPDDIPSIDPDKVPKEPDEKSLQEEVNLDIQAKKLRNDSLAQDIGLRRDLAKAIFVLIALWLYFVGCIILLQGFRFGGFQLADSAIIALITTTTASVLGIFLVVTRYFFPEK